MALRSGTANTALRALLVVANTRHGVEARRPLPAPAVCADGDERDRLKDPAATAAFLAACGLDVPDAPPDGAHLRSLAEARTAVHALARGDTDAYRTALSRLSAAGRDGGGWDAFAAGLAKPLADLFAQRERLKRCDNPACGWVFVDETRGRNQVWCAEQGCGPRLRVREFRRRRRLRVTAA